LLQRGEGGFRHGGAFSDRNGVALTVPEGMAERRPTATPYDGTVGSIMPVAALHNSLGSGSLLQQRHILLHEVPPLMD
jgi:hypothetical protein